MHAIGDICDFSCCFYFLDTKSVFITFLMQAIGVSLFIGIRYKNRSSESFQTGCDSEVCWLLQTLLDIECNFCCFLYSYGQESTIYIPDASGPRG